MVGVNVDPVAKAACVELFAGIIRNEAALYYCTDVLPPADRAADEGDKMFCNSDILVS